MATSGVLAQLRDLKSQIDASNHEARVALSQKQAMSEKLQEGVYVLTTRSRFTLEKCFFPAFSTLGQKEQEIAKLHALVFQTEKDLAS